MKITDEVRDLTIEKASAEAIKHVAVEQGMRLLRDDGLEKVRLGTTSIAEVARVS
jgi:type IV pilus assembly protein PilB